LVVARGKTGYEQSCDYSLQAFAILRRPLDADTMKDFIAAPRVQVVP
jgi:hypothetical protein